MPDDAETGGVMTRQSPTDRARNIRGDVERAFRRNNPLRVILDEVEDLIRKAICAHAAAIRREYTDREPPPGRTPRFL